MMMVEVAGVSAVSMGKSEQGGRCTVAMDDSYGRGFWTMEEVRRGPQPVCHKVGTGSESPEL